MARKLDDMEAVVQEDIHFTPRIEFWRRILFCTPRQLVEQNAGIKLYRALSSSFQPRALDVSGLLIRVELPRRQIAITRASATS